MEVVVIVDCDTPGNPVVAVLENTAVNHSVIEQYMSKGYGVTCRIVNEYTFPISDAAQLN